MKRSRLPQITINTPINEAVALMDLKLTEWIHDIGASMYSHRLAITQQTESGLWNHILINRYNRNESWIRFRPQDIELAKKFHSYPYFKKALQDGHTVLAQGYASGWNILLPSEKVIMSVHSTNLKMTEWDMKEHVKGLSKQYGL